MTMQRIRGGINTRRAPSNTMKVSGPGWGDASGGSAGLSSASSDHSLVASSSLQTSPQRPDATVCACLLAFSRVCASELGQARCGAVRAAVHTFTFTLYPLPQAVSFRPVQRITGDFTDTVPCSPPSLGPLARGDASHDL